MLHLACLPTHSHHAWASLPCFTVKLQIQQVSPSKPSPCQSSQGSLPHQGDFVLLTSQFQGHSGSPSAAWKGVGHLLGFAGLSSTRMENTQSQLSLPVLPDLALPITSVRDTQGLKQGTGISGFSFSSANPVGICLDISCWE